MGEIALGSVMQGKSVFVALFFAIILLPVFLRGSQSKGTIRASRAL